MVGTPGMLGARSLPVVATTGKERAPNMPGVPTIGESGLPDYEVTSWNGLAAPAGVAPEIVTLLSRAVNEVLRSPDIQAISRRAGKPAVAHQKSCALASRATLPNGGT